MSLNELFDHLWGMDGTHPFGNPDNLEDFLSQDKDLEEEVCEFIKGNFKTIITCKFNKQGFMVSHSVTCHSIDGMKSEDIIDHLKNQLAAAIASEDYGKAADIQKRINEFEGKSQGEESDSL